VNNRHNLKIGFSSNFTTIHHFLTPFFKRLLRGEENTLFEILKLGALDEDDATVPRYTE
jgi:hypothetical protein